MPLCGSIWSARKRFLVSRQSTIGSAKVVAWPLASQIFGCMMMVASRPDDIVAPAGHGAPPGILDVALEFRAEGAVIPKAVDAAVNFGRLKNEPPAFAQGDNPFHQIIGFGLHHRGHSFLQGAADVKGRRWLMGAFGSLGS